METLFYSGLRTLNELLTAGIAITAFSLLLYVLSFNLNDRVTRSFAIILSCVTFTFVAETLGSVANSPELIEFWLRLEWIGIILLPAAYLHFSDALLETTGRPSRGRRRTAVHLAYALSTFFLITFFLGWLVGPISPYTQPAPHLARTPLTWIFTLCYIAAMLVSGMILARAYRRTVTRTGRRRMVYLMVGALAPALGSYPFLLFSSGLLSQSTLLFWLIALATNAAVSILLVLMAYSVAFFGVYWPDRVIKRRLAKWLMRGPVTASATLAVTTIVRRTGLNYGIDYTALVPFVMVGSILIFEHLITISSPLWERLLFRGSERSDVRLLQILEERTLTSTDLQQFLEALLAALCDRLQTSQAFVASFGSSVSAEEPLTTRNSLSTRNSSSGKLDMFVSVGGDLSFKREDVPIELFETIASNNHTEEELFTWGDYWLVPLFDQHNDDLKMLGLIGIHHTENQMLDEDQKSAVHLLSQRAVLALRDRAREQQAFQSLEEISSQVDMIQKLRAAARYDSTEVLTSPTPEWANLESGQLERWVKDALTHYWGGPKLTQNPLMQLKVVQETAENQEENTTNALRSILRQAIEQTRPAGERRFTADWILYNILEMKFVEGRKVREIASRLAMSEADLYRKQRVAIEAVAKSLYEMEQQARGKETLVN
jgi:hypothetical protein